MAEGRVGHQELVVDNGVLGVRKLPGEKSPPSPEPVKELLKNNTQVSIESIHSERDRNVRERMVKAESNTWGQARALPGPLRVSVREVRILARPPRKFLY